MKPLGKRLTQTLGFLRVRALPTGLHLRSVPEVSACADRRMTLRRIAPNFRLSDTDQIPVV